MRSMRKWGGMLRPIGFAARALVRSPGFTLPALAILCAGMTAATAIFTVADSILFRPLDLPSPEALVIVCEDIRLAIGAAPIDLLVAAVRANLVAVVAGPGVGLVGATAAGRVLAGLAHGVSPTDPVSLLSSVAVLGLAAGLAALSPAWRAVRADPLRAIHTE